MNIPKLVIAMNYIDDDLICEAVMYRPSYIRLVWLRYCVIAACLCTIIFGTIKISRNLSPNSDSNTPVYGVLAEIIEISSDGIYQVKITGEDKNFIIGDIVTINCKNINDSSNAPMLKIGDIIAITYSHYEKTSFSYEITPGQIHFIQPDSN